MFKIKIPDFNWKKWLLVSLFVVAIFFIYKILDAYAAGALALVIQSILVFLELLSPFISGLLLAYLLHIPCQGIEKLLTKIPPPLLTKRAHPSNIIKVSSPKEIPAYLLYFIKEIPFFARNALVISLRFVAKHARPLSVLCFGLIIIGLVVGASAFIIPSVQKSISDLVANLPYLTTTAQTYIADLREHPFLNLVDWNALLDTATKFLTEQLDFSKLGNLGSWAANMVKSVFNVIMTSVVAIYMLLNPTPFFKTVNRIARIFTKDQTLKALAEYIKRFNVIFSKFISCQILDSLIVGTIGGIGLTIMGVKYAPLLAVVMAVLNIIPYVGSIMSVTIACLTTVLTTGGFTGQFWAVLIFLIILQQADGNIIIPRLLGQTLNLNPVVIMFTIILGGAYYGILGMFLSVPVMAICKIILGDIMRFLEERQRKKRENPGNPDTEAETVAEIEADTTEADMKN